MAAPMSVSNGAASRRRRRVRLLQGAFAVVAVVVTFAVFLPSIADYGSVWDAVQSMSAAQVVLLGVVATWNILTFGPNWMVALPGLRFRQSLELNMASTAVANVVPGGSAVSFGISWAMLREWGFERRAVALALILTGVGNNLANVGYPLVAFTAWSLVRLLTAIPITPGGVGIAELVLVGTMTQFGGDEPAVVAAVLLFRALTLLPPIFIGAIVAFTWRRHERHIA
jgi:uncharacterized membrane protein YbhN (UPF0104 family)